MLDRLRAVVFLVQGFLVDSNKTVALPKLPTQTSPALKGHFFPKANRPVDLWVSPVWPGPERSRKSWVLWGCPSKVAGSAFVVPSEPLGQHRGALRL